MNRLLLPAVLFLLTSVISAYPKPQTQTEDVITPEPGRQIEREISGAELNGLGESEKAEELATHALPIARAAGDPSAEAWLLDTIGSSYNERGDRAKALEFFNRALRLRSADDPVGRVNTLTFTTRRWSLCEL